MSNRDRRGVYGRTSSASSGSAANACTVDDSRTQQGATTRWPVSRSAPDHLRRRALQTTPSADVASPLTPKNQAPWPTHIRRGPVNQPPTAATLTCIQPWFGRNCPISRRRQVPGRTGGSCSQPPLRSAAKPGMIARLDGQHRENQPELLQCQPSKVTPAQSCPVNAHSGGCTADLCACRLNGNRATRHCSFSGTSLLPHRVFACAAES